MKEHFAQNIAQNTLHFEEELVERGNKRLISPLYRQRMERTPFNEQSYHGAFAGGVIRQDCHIISHFSTQKSVFEIQLVPIYSLFDETRNLKNKNHGM